MPEAYGVRHETEPEHIAAEGSVPIRVMIVDDHPLARRGLRHLIDDGEEFVVCGEADDVETAIDEIPASRPDLMLIDLTLRTSNGLELIEKLKARGDAIHFLVVSMHDDAIFVERALRAGAEGYVCKEVASNTIIDAMRRVLAGGVYVEPRFAEKFVRRLANGQASSSKLPVESLSERETEVFRMQGQGKSVKQIAAELGLSPKTIETYRESIKAKLHIDSSNELLRYAVQWLNTQN